MMNWDGTSGGWLGWAAAMGMMVVFWGGLVWVAVVLLRSSGRGPHPEQPGALELLDQRLASGDIDEEDYRVRRQLLSGDGRVR
jgi:putative membrane protein